MRPRRGAVPGAGALRGTPSCMVPLMMVMVMVMMMVMVHLWIAVSSGCCGAVAAGETWKVMPSIRLPSDLQQPASIDLPHTSAAQLARAAHTSLCGFSLSLSITSLCLPCRQHLVPRRAFCSNNSHGLNTRVRVDVPSVPPPPAPARRSARPTAPTALRGRPRWAGPCEPRAPATQGRGAALLLAAVLGARAHGHVSAGMSARSGRCYPLLCMRLGARAER